MTVRDQTYSAHMGSSMTVSCVLTSGTLETLSSSLDPGRLCGIGWCW